MPQKSDLSPKDALENIFDAFAEATSLDYEEAKQVLRETGLDPEKVVTRGLARVKSMQGMAKLRLAESKWKQLLSTAKEKIAQLGQDIVGDPRERLAKLIAESGNISLQAHFRKLESLGEKDVLEMLNEAELLELIELVEKETGKNNFKEIFYA